MFWKHKCFGNISQLETRPLIGWPSGSTNQRPGLQLIYVSKTLMLPKHLHMIRPLKCSSLDKTNIQGTQVSLQGNTLVWLFANLHNVCGSSSIYLHTYCRTLKTKYALDPSIWRCQLLFLMLAVGWWLVVVVKLESVYQLISPTLATQSHSAVRTPAAAAAKGHPILAVQHILELLQQPTHHFRT